MEPVKNDDWKVRDGEPSMRVATAPMADQSKGVLVQSMTNGQMVALHMRPAVARWLAEQLVGAAQAAESRLIVADGPLTNGKGELH